MLNAGGYVLTGDANGPIDSASDLLYSQIFWSMSEYQARTSAERTMTTMVAQAKAGKYVAGTTPIGYDRNPDGTLEVNLDEAPIITSIFEGIASGKSLGSIAAELNAKGYVTRTNRKFSKQAIGYIAKNEIYVGTLIYNREDSRSNPHTLLLGDFAEVRVESNHQPIVTKETFDLVQSILGNKLTNSTNESQHVYLLSGIMKCKACGKTMIGWSAKCGANKAQRYEYRCPDHKKNGCTTKGINADYIDNVVLDAVINVIKTCNMSEAIKASMEPKIACENAILTRCKQHYGRLVRKFSSLVEKSLDSSVSKSVLNVIDAQIEEYARAMEEYQTKINNQEQIISELSAYTYTDITKEQLLANRDAARQIIRFLVASVDVDDASDSIEITLNTMD